jgi:hypothetical protein
VAAQVTVDAVTTTLFKLALGLGVWSGGTARFYPLQTIQAQGNVLMDTLNRHQLVIYLDPVSRVLAVHRTSSPVRGWDDDTLLLQSGERVCSGYVLSQGSQKRPLDSLNHQFARWYGFSYMFPSCEIFSVNQ